MAPPPRASTAPPTHPPPISTASRSRALYFLHSFPNSIVKLVSLGFLNPIHHTANFVIAHEEPPTFWGDNDGRRRTAKNRTVAKTQRRQGSPRGRARGCPPLTKSADGAVRDQGSRSPRGRSEDTLPPELGLLAGSARRVRTALDSV